MEGRDLHATAGSHFRRRLRGRSVVYGGCVAVGFGIAAGAVRHDPLAVPVVALVAIALVLIVQWTRAEDEAANEFFTRLAPALGLQYVVSGSLPPVTPLLSAGDSRGYEHVMEGPLFGDLGGPTCTLAHYTFKTTQSHGEAGSRTVSHPSTVAATEVGAALPVFHGVYVRRRPKIRVPGFLWADWLARAHAEEVDLESSDFEGLYELRAARDQDRRALYELFSPSFIVWLAEHPLRPGFECKAGMLVVFVPEHEGDADRLMLFHEAAREVGRRVIAAVAASQAATSAG